MTYKFDIFPFISKLNTGDLMCFEGLTDEDKKQVSPFMCMKFMSGTQDKTQIVLLNENVNTFIFRSSDKSFLFKLLAASTSGKTRSVRWPGQLKDKTSAFTNVIAEFYDCSLREAKLMEQNFNTEDIVQMAEQLGYIDEELKKLRKK